ncbi:FERM and PDZ domain-containing protein 1 isoform X2 [Coregonus clupeaformis]|uniref:FERM and PDZ domain-containing protein 1 isoform X2 n=1 Tax=Coregonus clupeaformis TaxID=59861 RepID=UPI001E1C3C2E|nr:FERM and PDZ domain-containing protein 1 isoform X2 [Coregonus clupeaformis]
MEEKERSRSRSLSRSRRATRVQQVVGTLIRRTRESLSRERILGDGRSSRSGSVSSQNFPVRLTVQIVRDPVLDSSGLGFTLSKQHPLLIRDVATGGPADGILYPGDQVLQMNDLVVDYLSYEQLQDITRDLEDFVTMTILRNMTGPKSSIMSAEKRARLRSNPIKVRFAEEVVVNGHTQGNSLLFLPNVLKVYLENGQTKAFKFDATTTIKDIILTLKDKLSICCIEYFSLVLEQQYSITKLLLLHEDEFIHKVVQKKENSSHDYRCLFRVCFIPRDPLELLQEDPTAFEYLFLQSVGDVLQERFAVEMKCNTALRLAALHMHERLDSIGSTRTSVKSIMKEFGLDSFISPTLLSNMREKDLRKAISYHLKKIQSLLEPQQKVIPATQARLAYLTQLAELISYGGRSYTATMMLQDREALVSLLVGARYGLSQVVNHKLNMVSTLVDFSSISRVELLSESDRVSLLRISLHDIKPFALLMDSLAAKDLACLLGGYCKLLVDPRVCVFRLGRPKVRVHRIPAEEGYVSRCCSDSDDSSDEDYPAEPPPTHTRKRHTPASKDREGWRREKEEQRGAEGKKERAEKEDEDKQEVKIIVTSEKDMEVEEEDGREIHLGNKANKGTVEQDMVLDTNWYHTDPRVNSSFSSLSSGSLSAALEECGATAAARGGDPAKASSHVDALREDSPSLRSQRPTQGITTLDVHHPFLLEVTSPSPQRQRKGAAGSTASASVRPNNLSYRSNDSLCLCFAELSQGSYLPSPPEATSDEEETEEVEDDDDEEELRRLSKIPSHIDLRLIDKICARSNKTASKNKLDIPRIIPNVTSFCEKRAVCSSAHKGEERLSSHSGDSEPFLTPSPNPPPPIARESASESDDEFFDAQERFTPPVPPDGAENSWDVADNKRHSKRWSGTGNGLPVVPEREPPSPLKKKHSSPDHKKQQEIQRDPKPHSNQASTQRVDAKTKPPPLAPKPQLPPKPELAPKPQMGPQRSPQRGGPYSHCNGDAGGGHAGLLEIDTMEPDTMEFKSVTSGAVGPPLTSPLITAVRKSQQPPAGPQGVENGPKIENSSKQENGSKNGTHHVLPKDHVPVTSDKQTAEVETKTNRVSLLKGAVRTGVGVDPPKKLPSLSPIPRSASGDEIRLSLATPPPLSPKPSPPSLHPLSVLPILVSPNEKEGMCPPNGLQPWVSRNGSIQTGRRVSLSHENLSPKSTDAPLSLTTSLTTSSSKGTAGGPESTGRSGSGSDLRVSSSSLGGRLPTSALRGRIQALPWYMTRSQEILGTLDYPSTNSINGDVTSGYGSGLSVSGASEVSKVTAQATVGETAGGKGKKEVLEDGAEVVIATIKEFQEVTNGSHPNLTLRENSTHVSEPYMFLGSCKSEQPQSRPHSEVGLGGGSGPPLEGDSLEHTPPPDHRKECGCRTVYANCFSGDVEDGCGFDEELTIYEFSKRTRPKPAPFTPLPSPTSPVPSPNILSLLRDTPRPLSTLSNTSSELSPLLSRPISPTPPIGSLRSLTNKQYGGLKGGFVSLRQDIDQLLLVLERGTAGPPPSSEPSKTDQDEGGEGGLNPTKGEGPTPCCGGASPPPMTEPERSLLQAEARRLATGCQRATRVGWAPEEALRSLSNSFSALVQLSAACLRTHPCPGCDVCRNGGQTQSSDDDEGQEEALDKLKEIVGLYRGFVGAVETAGAGAGSGSGSGTGSGVGQGEGEGVRLLAKRCTVLISSVFALTQLFRTHSPDTPGHTPLNF